MSSNTLNLSQNYIDLINDGLIILPDKSLNKTISDLNERNFFKKQARMYHFHPRLSLIHYRIITIGAHSPNRWEIP